MTTRLDALLACQRLFKEALPQFNWGASALDADAIRLLNETPAKVAAALRDDNELALLRRVYEAARRVLRFNGVDRAKTAAAVDELDSAIEEVKQLDGGYGEVPEQRVVCAAIRAEDGSILLGVRHYSADMRRQIEQRRDGKKFEHRHDQDQGFVDQRGAYLSREEAYRVAARAGQIVRPHACGEGLDGPKLYSEGLY